MPTAARARAKSSKAKQPGKRLVDLANVGPATLRDFEVLGVRSVAQLAKRDPLALYRTLCRRTGQRHDPCCIDVFMATTAEARGEPARPWWAYTKRRKKMLEGR